MKRAVGYVRVSEEEQAKGHSPDFQMSFVKSTVLSLGWQLAENGIAFRGRIEEPTVPGFYTDLGGHGWDINRPALRAMIMAGKAKKFDIVVVWRQDRLSRTYEDISLILRAFLKFGVSVYLDGKLWEPKDAFVVGVKALVSEEELRKLRDATNRGIAEAKDKGIRFARVPTGLKKTADKTAFEVTQQGKEIYEAFESGTSYEGIVEIFDVTFSKAMRIVRNVRALYNGQLESILLDERKRMYERKKQMKERERAERKAFSDWLRGMAGVEFE